MTNKNKTTDYGLAVLAYKAGNYDAAATFANRSLKSGFNAKALSIIAHCLAKQRNMKSLRNVLDILDVESDPSLAALEFRSLCHEKRWPEACDLLTRYYATHGFDDAVTAMRETLEAQHLATETGLLSHIDTLPGIARLSPFWRIIHSATRLPNDPVPAGDHQAGGQAIFIEATAFLDNARHGLHLTGIQRSLYETIRSVARCAELSDRSNVCFFGRFSGVMHSVPISRFIKCVEQQGLQAASNDLLLAESAPHSLQGVVSTIEVNRVVLGPDDTLFVMDVFWSIYFRALYEVFMHSPCRKILLIHDLIGIKMAEENATGVNERFAVAVERLLPIADVIVAQSNATRIDILDFLLDSGVSKPVFTLRFAADVLSPTELPLSPIEADTFEQLKGKRLLLSIGTLSRRKGFVQLAEAFETALPDLGLDTALVLAGRFQANLPEAKKLRSLIDRQPSRIFWVDSPSDALVDKLYRECTAVALLSTYEGWGLPASEALAYRKPLLLSNRTALPEVGGDAAHYVNPEDPKEISSAIRLIFNNYDFLALLSDRSAAAKLRTWDDVANDFAALIKVAAGKSPC